MKKIVALSLAFVALLGAKEIKNKDVFLSDTASVDSLRQFLKANKDEIVKLNLSYCANENSLKILEKNANERKGGVKFSGIAEDYKPSKDVTIEYYGEHFDLGEGYDDEGNAAIDEGQMIIRYSPREGSFQSLTLQVGGSERGTRYKWRYLWDEKARCKDGEVRLDGTFYVADGEYPAARDLGDKGDFDIFALDPIAKKYFKLLEYR